MKIFAIVGMGRAGIEFLQSLFDGHTQILQLPGMIRFNKKFLNSLEMDSKSFINYFIDNNEFFFNSLLQKLERHDQLGLKKNEHYTVNKNIFKKEFLILYDKTNKKKIDKLICLHKAYFLSSGISLSKKKILIVNIHTLDYFKNFNSTFIDYKKIEIILTIRDPLASLSSTIKNWLSYEKGKHLTSQSLFLNIYVHLNTINDLIKFKRNIIIVQLEKLHQNSKYILKNLCKKLLIKYEESLQISTFFNKQWWGDSISKKYLNGLNPNFKNSFKKKFFYDKDISILEKKLFTIIKKYNYKFRSKKNFNFLYNFLPFKFELIIWSNCFKNKNYIQVILILFYYIKRIILIFYIKQKKISLLPSPIL